MWPTKLIDPDGREVLYVRRYGNMAEYLDSASNKTLWVIYNSVGQICHGQDVYTPVEEPSRLCVNC